MTNWCILRTAPSRTLLLAAALTDAGFRAWTPRETRIVRLSRSKAKKEMTVPLIPTIVFAEYDRLPLLVGISRMPSPTIQVWCEDEHRMVSLPIPSFSVFRHLDVYPRIDDQALDALRVAEQSVKPRRERHTFRRDDPVKIYGAGFDGLIGSVQGTRGRYAIVTFPGFTQSATFDARLLLPADQIA